MTPFINIFGVEVSTWRIVVLASVAICWVLFLIRSKKLGYAFYPVFLWLLFGLPVGTLGGHLFNKIIPAVFGFNSESYSFTGITVIGSIIACILYSLLYIKYVIKAQPMQLMDAVAFTFPLSTLLGRIGCILNGCCYGTLAPDSLRTSACSILTIKVNSFVPSSQVREEYLNVPVDSIIWNLPLLFMLHSFVILVVTETLYHKREKWNLYPGTVFAATGAMYSGGRFFLEFMRKEGTIHNSILNPWQPAILVLFFVFFAWFCFALYKRHINLSLHK